MKADRVPLTKIGGAFFLPRPRSLSQDSSTVN